MNETVQPPTWQAEARMVQETKVQVRAIDGGFAIIATDHIGASGEEIVLTISQQQGEDLGRWLLGWGVPEDA